MARGELMKKLLASYGRDDEFRAVAEQIITEEEKKNNRVLASSLRKRGEQPRPRAVHLVTNIAITLDEARARVRSNWMVMQNSPQGPHLSSGGAYIDEMVRTDGRWLFRYRKIDRFIAA